MTEEKETLPIRNIDPELKRQFQIKILENNHDSMSAVIRLLMELYIAGKVKIK